MWVTVTISAGGLGMGFSASWPRVAASARSSVILSFSLLLSIFAKELLSWSGAPGEQCWPQAGGLGGIKTSDSTNVKHTPLGPGSTVVAGRFSADADPCCSFLSWALLSGLPFPPGTRRPSQERSQAPVCGLAPQADPVSSSTKRGQKTDCCVD